MKFFALLSVAVVMCVDATLHGGSSVVQRSDDGHGNYAFGYKEQHASGGTSRQEKGGPGHVVGSYTLNDHDGRSRVVNYVADGHGFRASIKTNEPGVDSKEDPAHVSINGGKVVAFAEPIAEKFYGGGGYGGYGGAYGGGYGKGYAEPEAYGYGLGGGYGHGGGPLGSYSVKVNHVGGYGGHGGLAEYGRGGYGWGGHGKW